ncbi:hypothetical protein MMC22_002950 [Lobaria immixta]|nr:hypothetical protein [Lobaria immixta]
MSAYAYKDAVRSRLRQQPQLKYLESFMTNDRLGNSVCRDRSSIARSAIVLDRVGDVWIERSERSTVDFWKPLPNSDGQAIILNYLDSEAIEGLGQEFSLSPEFFQSHLAGSEQHHSGDWATSDLTAPPCLRSSRRQGNFFIIDLRRPCDVSSSSKLESFNYHRKQRCSLLRSFHLTNGSDVLFHHERYSVAWFMGDPRRRIGAVICICDPTANSEIDDNLQRESVAAIKSLPPGQEFNASLINHFHTPFSRIIILWNTVAFHMDLQVSALEDQLEHDFWDKPQNPVSILHTTQRLSRRIMSYLGQLGSMKSDMGCRTNQNALEDVEGKLKILLQRTDKAIPALLASIAISEGAKASSLTAVALWFAPLSLAVSIVGIDGRSPFGGRKYLIMACIAIPLLLLVIAVANTSDKLMGALGRRRGGRAIVSLFKPETRIR